MGLSDTNAGCVMPQEDQDEIMAKINANPNYAEWRERMKSELSDYLAATERAM